MNDLAARVRVIAVALRDALPEGPHRDEASAIVDRIDGPLRVAVAGRVKAGKSTLLNALVGERLAPTDAGECTRLVAWYEHGAQYRVDAVLRSGDGAELAFTRRDGALVIDLGGHLLSTIDHLRVTWPSRALEGVTLIDTPGLSSLDDATSARTRSFLAVDDARPSSADVVLYLMRHLHREDGRFLDALVDRTLGPVSPASAVAVLSRADEIGAGRLDAMASAARIAARYAADDRVRRMCVTVLPVAALLAETASTVQEQEVAILRDIAGLPADDLHRLLLACDSFAHPWPGIDIPAERRAALVGRFGLYGIRLAVHHLRSGSVGTASVLADVLYDASGLKALVDELESRFVPQSRSLKAAAGLVALRSLAIRVPGVADHVTRAVEELAAASLELAELRLLQLVVGGDTALAQEEIDAAVALARRRTSTDLDPALDGQISRAAALAEVERWRTRGVAQFTDGPTREACDLAARLAEAAAVRSMA